MAAPCRCAKAVEYTVQIAHGLAAAHDRGITHRDLKPENVFITDDGRAKILDFGLAKLTQAESTLAGLSVLPTTPPNTLPGVVLGTVGYMAPEQVRGLTADHRSDIFAFGAILYEMLSGRPAFGGDIAMDTMTAILKEDPPDLPVWAPDGSRVLFNSTAGGARPEHPGIGWQVAGVHERGIRATVAPRWERAVLPGARPPNHVGRGESCRRDVRG